MLLLLETPFVLGCVLAALLPLLLFAAFRVRGQLQRHKYLTGAPPSGKPAHLLAPAGEVADPEMTLGAYLGTKYAEAQASTNYIVPLGLFWVTWAFGWYWSVVSLAMVLLPGDAQWAHYPLVAKFAPVPAAAFVGSAAIITTHLTLRAVRGDLQPKAFTHLASRLLVGTLLAWAVARLSGAVTGSLSVQLFVALGGGLFPESALLVIERQWRSFVGLGVSASSSLPLRALQGINADDELRLWEEGVTDAQHMATESLTSLVVNTPYSIERLIDWKDQAFLYVYAAEDLGKWRALNCRGAMDILGLDATYYGQTRHDAIVPEIAAALGKPVPVIERTVDTFFNDPRVHQLWNYLKLAYPASQAQPITGQPAGTPAA